MMVVPDHPTPLPMPAFPRTLIAAATLLPPGFLAFDLPAQSAVATRVAGTVTTWYSLALRSSAAVPVDRIPYTSRLYVANAASGDVRVVDATSPSDFPPTLSVGIWSRPTAIAVNPATNRIYAVTQD